MNDYKYKYYVFTKSVNHDSQKSWSYDKLVIKWYSRIIHVTVPYQVEMCRNPGVVFKLRNYYYVVLYMYVKTKIYMYLYTIEHKAIIPGIKWSVSGYPRYKMVCFWLS
jgi:hypothetical protein